MNAPETAVASTSSRRIGRPWSDLVVVAVGAAGLVLSAVPVDAHHVTSVERIVFRVINGPPLLPFVVVWPIMQLGNLLVIPVAALAAAVARRYRLAAGMLLGGAGTYVLAKVVKRIVVRGRPANLVPDVHIRGAAAKGLGYVSGHAAVTALLVTLAWPYLGRRWRWVPVAAAIAVALARVYVGAHLPLDVVGGAALGVAVAGVVRLLLGRPVPCS